MRPISEIIKEKPWMGWLIFFATIIVVFVLGLFAATIVERRAEAVFAYTPQVKHDKYEPRNEVWGQNFPRQYQSYMNTADTTFSSKYNTSGLRDALADNPRMVILWSGYAFSMDYNQPRGHYYAVTDVYNTLRVGSPMDGEKSFQPNTCWTCKSSDVPRLMQEHGIAEFYAGTWEMWGGEVVNHIGCADCHDAETMNLHITRPALIEAFERQGKDITKASHQEMRSLVCAQCHVEYYFSKNVVEDVNYLVFPWDDGMNFDDIEAYFDRIGFTDWVHGLSRAPMLKAQHPDYEVWSTGIHADRGVSCADCHMPYKSEGGMKFTDHHIQSPLNNVANSCQVCHREETARLVQNVYDRQDKIYEIRTQLEDQLVKAHIEAAFAWDLGASEDQMQDILMDIRHAQWRWDFAAAGHGNAFHNPLETSRMISTGKTKAQDARVKLARLIASLGHTEPVPMPDISTKAKAQEYIGLDIPKRQADKEKFLNTVVPQWLEAAREREATYDVRVN
ncbi:ammonia-forming cytochrome c nitrite reductase [Alkalitalea saponilacus]|uniref:Cytochrome c-552 n=1 Tax=Alkalitalea saponilacus TaxID=889453 RepID=A0A1T5H4W6_9BACT|nr:ammonia-forming cytochrome c nitrite reductase [Alkalitalea saponilacus]ASB50887.1 ammonia-forming cytochrome c nitrite reductase subunit c552 [Alkalitalea saponilacus]SKC15641.1 nitrite reductase (cytochrome c-552) [Alkalitalea saponilacus]